MQIMTRKCCWFLNKKRIMSSKSFQFHNWLDISFIEEFLFCAERKSELEGLLREFTNTWEKNHCKRWKQQTFRKVLHSGAAWGELHLHCVGRLKRGETTSPTLAPPSPPQPCQAHLHHLSTIHPLNQRGLRHHHPQQVLWKILLWKKLRKNEKHKK